MFEIELTGCTPEPLMSYLKALGVFRLVAEQADPSVRLSWRGGVATLHTTLDRESLLRFFLEEYRPTPIVAPWNGGSGFSGSGSDPVDAIAGSTVPRMKLYRSTIQAIRSIPLDTLEKERILETCRNELPDEVVDWLDTCFVLGEERPSYFPLLGTGGNDGRLEFTNNFMQRVADVISFTENEGPRTHSHEFLCSALYADTLVSLSKSAIGQFSPGSIGGPNGIQGKFEADSRVNSWDFVLMIEGSLLFAGAISRKLNSAGSMKSVFPFSVESIAVGYGSSTANEETTDGSRAELWLPLWERPTSFAEVKRLFAEGRAQLGRRQARNSVEFALAVNLLGVERGITSFSRFGFLKRNGLAFLAAPLGRITVTAHPEARLLEDPRLVEWLVQLRRACSDKGKTPSRYQTALRGIDRAMFDFANRSEQGNDAVYLTEVLRAIGRAERTLALAGLSWLKDKQYGWKIRPLFRMSPKWLKQADDGSAEFGLAASLASIQATDDLGPLRGFLAPVKVLIRAKKTKAVEWNPDSVSAVWRRGSLVANLSAVFRRRQMEAFRSGEEGVPLSSNHPARLDHVMQFLNDRIDEDKLADLIWGMLGINWDQVVAPPDEKPQMPVPMEYGIPKLLVMKRSFVSKRIIRKVPKPNHPNSKLIWNITKDPNSNANAKPDPNVFHPLSSGRSNSEAVRECVDCAALRLKAGGLLVHGYQNRRQSGRSLAITSTIPPERLLAAMLFPLSNDDLRRIANSVLSPPKTQE